MDINIVQVLHALSYATYVALAVYVLSKNSREPLNITCAVFLLCFAIWSFCMIFVHDPHCTKEAARIIYNVEVFGWGPFASAFLWLAFLFTGKKKILRNRIFQIISVAIPLSLVYASFRNYLFVDLVLEPYGWAGVWGTSFWTCMFFVYYTSFVLFGCYLIWRYSVKQENVIKKRQANIIVAVVGISFVLGSITDTILPALGKHDIPNVADIIILLYAGGLIYAITKYAFLSIEEGDVVDQVIAMISDPVFFVDPDGNIVKTNNVMRKLLGYKEDELAGKNWSILSPQADSVGLNFQGRDLHRNYDEDIIDNIEFEFVTKEGEKIRTLIARIPVVDRAKTMKGVMFVLKNRNHTN